MSDASHSKTLQHALAHHSAGRLTQAEKLYREILLQDPDQADALHLLGVVTLQAGHGQLAIDLIRRAVATAPSRAEFHSNLGEAYRISHRLDEAATSLRQALSLRPDFPAALNSLGVVLGAQHKTDEALACFRHAIRLQPDSADAYHNLGYFFAQRGQLEDAQDCLQKALALRSNAAETHNCLGSIFKERGQLNEAVASYRRAIALNPNLAEAHNNLGVSLKDLGQIDEAFASYQHAIALKSDFAEAHCNLGIVHRERGQLGAALASYHRAIALKPDYPGAHNNLGSVFKESGQFDDALVSYQRAIALDPNFAEAYNNLGILRITLGQFDAAIASFRRAIALRPDLADAHSNLGVAFKERGQLDDALAACQRALALEPDYAEAHSNLGVVLAELGQFDAALAACQRALFLKPALAEAHSNLGGVLKERGQLDEAFAACRRALTLKPGFAVAHVNLGEVYKERGQLDEAIVCYRRALELKPAFAAGHSNLIPALLYRSGHDAEVIDAELRRWKQQHARPAADLLCHTIDPAPDRRLRIGYLSPDFRNHPVGRFLLPLFTHHSHSSVEIFCYSNTHPHDQLTAKLRSRATGWREIAGHTDRQAADLIIEDRVDILVDLALHTAKNRLPILALRPAPVQATYLAYPGNSGLDTVDFRITDAYLDPLDNPTSGKIEQPLRLAGTYWCYQPTEGALLDAGTLPALTSGRVTFGCFNNFCKVTPETLAAWCCLLRAVPDARLRLHVRPGSHRSRVLDFFASHAVDPERVDFLGYGPEVEYFQSYRSIDVALDPFPFPGGTTTCDALWMGVPVVSLAGPTPVTRGGLSLLSNVGLPDLVAHTVDNYIEVAAALAHDLPRLAALRTGLRQRMQRSPLMDAPRFARDIESAYRTMWQWWCEQRTAPPAPP